MSGDDQKKDLTSIIDLPQAEPIKNDDGTPEFNALPAVEQIDNFESLDQIGMMDHPTTPIEEQLPMEGDSAVKAFDPNAFQPMIDPGAAPTVEPPIEVSQAQPMNFEQPAFDSAPPAIPAEFQLNTSFEATAVISPEPAQEMVTAFKHEESPTVIPSSPPPTIDDIRSYSEQAQETSLEYSRAVPFRLLISGEFDPFARDKLLLFITENPIGISSSDLDFQINAGRVLIPQISEYAGIRLIQELRETGLHFKLTSVELDTDEAVPEAETQRYQWNAASESKALVPEVVILDSEAINSSIHQIIDSLQTVQFIRAEVIELEKSDMFQELLNRMLTHLKVKAARRGAIALTHVKHTVRPLSAASQYEVHLTASLVKSLV